MKLDEINGWHEHKMLVMKSLERQHEINVGFARQLHEAEKNLAVLSTKVALAGIIASIVTSAIVSIAIALTR